MQPIEQIQVTTLEVVCDGGGPLGHPRVYLHIDQDEGNRVTCGYCSRTYVYRDPHASAA